MPRIFVKATDEVSGECLMKARRWLAEPNQKMFTSMRNGAVGAVAEYLANEKGFTLYDCNAKYPKGDDNG